MKIRTRDGTMREVADGYILRDGEAFVVGLPFMDSRPMIHDGNGGPAGCRPGFLYSDANEQAERALADAYKEYDATLGERWRKGPGQPSAESKPPTAPLVFDSPQAARDAVAASYAEYDELLTNRWRRQW